MLEWIRFGIVAALFAAGIIVLFISIFGTFRLKYSLNRMHSAAMCDSLVLMLFIAGLVIASGINVISLKILFIVFVQWCASPLVAHIFVKTKYLTDKHLSDYCQVCFDDEKEDDEK